MQIETALILYGIYLAYIAYMVVIQQYLTVGVPTNTKNITIERLRTAHKVKIRTYRKKRTHPGYTIFNTIYLNETNFSDTKRLRHVFFHELYHLKRGHYYKEQSLRVVTGATILLFSLLNPWIVGGIMLSMGVIIVLVGKSFEKKATEYAHSKVKI